MVQSIGLYEKNTDFHWEEAGTLERAPQRELSWFQSRLTRDVG